MTAFTMPLWFRRTPFYSAMQRQERIGVEARRVALAAERDAIHRAEATAAPKRLREREKADAALQAAEEAAHRARLAHAEACGKLAAAAVGPSSRLNAIEAQLHHLAHPAIGDAIGRVLDALDAARRMAVPDARARLAVLGDARRQLDLLYQTTAVDPEAETARILEAANLPIMAAA
jgi:hypothetical protein